MAIAATGVVAASPGLGTQPAVAAALALLSRGMDAAQHLLIEAPLAFASLVSPVRTASPVCCRFWAVRVLCEALTGAAPQQLHMQPPCCASNPAQCINTPKRIAAADTRTRGASRRPAARRINLRAAARRRAARVSGLACAGTSVRWPCRPAHPVL
jgi:hypothetical protein